MDTKQQQQSQDSLSEIWLNPIFLARRLRRRYFHPYIPIIPTDASHEA